MTMETAMEGPPSLDTILDKYVGGSGRYQLANTVGMALVYYAGLYALFMTVFVAYVPPHRCRVDFCDEPYNGSKVVQDINEPAWLEFAIPLEDGASNFFGQKNTFDGCKMFARKESYDPKRLDNG